MFGVGSNEGVPAMWGNMVPTAQEENYSHRMNQAKDQRLDLPQGHTQRSDPRIFCCIHCPYRATQKGNLQRHIRTHTGELPFSCSHCSYRSKDPSNLARHIRRKHIHKQQQ